MKVKLFGDLREKVERGEVIGGSSIILTINDPKIETVFDIVQKLSIEETEISHIFVNGKYSGLKKKVKNNDLVALFPRNMGLLYKWYFNRDEDE